jgi:acyl dehydratase
MTDIYFEDFCNGQTFELGSHTIRKKEILEFANEFDPQTFHIDENAAKRSIYGEIIASGWHTGSIYMRLLDDGLLNRVASMGSPGAEISWLLPVHAEDTISAYCKIDGTRLSESKPDRGLIEMIGYIHNQKNNLVMTQKGILFVKSRK